LVKKYNLAIQGTLPLAVGFGISQPHHVRELVRAGANGVIVGSAFVKIVAANSRNVAQASNKLKRLARNLKKATVLKA
jgi:tryptophan synthase alpha chain